MKLGSWIVSWIIGLAGAWGILELSKTTETDWFGLPKLLIACVLFVVFFVIGAVLMYSCGKRPGRKLRDDSDLEKTRD